MSSLKRRIRHRIYGRVSRSRYAALWEQIDLLKILVQRDLEARYKGSILGRFWVVMNQVAQLLVYTYAFAIVLKAQPPELGALQIQPDSLVYVLLKGLQIKPASFVYALWLFAGLVPWNAFMMGMMQSSMAVLNQPNLVKKVVFPLSLLPLVPVGATFLEGSLGLLLLSLILLSAHMLSITIVALPLVWIPQLLLTAGIGYFTAALTVFLRDIPQTLGVISNLWFYLTPIVYSASVLPKSWQPIVLWVNPMAAVVQLYRDFLGFRNGGDAIHWSELAVLWGVAMIIFTIGFGLYQRLKKGFADVL